MFEHYKEKPYKKKEIIELIQEHGLQGEGILSYLDFSKNSDKTKFGILIEKFLGRILYGIVLKCIDDANKTSCYKRYIFSEFKINVDDKIINLDNLINLRYPRNEIKNSNNYSNTNPNKVDEVDKIFTPNIIIEYIYQIIEKEPEKQIETQNLYEKLKELMQDEYNEQEIEKIIKKLFTEASLFEPRSGWLKKL